MTQSAFNASAGAPADSYDFSHNYRQLKKLIQDLKVEDNSSIRKEIFGEEERDRKLTKKQVKQLFRLLRKIEPHYEACWNPPIPEELESSIRCKDSARWLPWELEAIEKVDAWREDLQQRKLAARRMLEEALESIRKGEDLP